MVCLLLDEPFVVGRVQFGFFTREYFKHFVEQHEANHPNEDNHGYEDLWKTYSGRCFAMLPVNAEIEKAKEIAFKHCGLAVDVLKICSNTMIVPEFECTFEIDQRLSRNTRNEIIVEKIANEGELSISLYGAGQPFSMHKLQMQQFKERGLDDFSEFLLELEGEQSELQKMIVVAIQRLANAFTIKDLYYRIAEICSILESLLLVSDTGSMMDPVCKYFCRLVHSNPGDRKELDKLYRKIYSVRSAWVHHAKKSNFELSDLSLLQQATHALLRVLIYKTKSHSTKQTILEEIDEALYNA